MKNRIQELRKERRVTQSELADAAHKIAQYFGMNIEDIFVFDKEEENICC